MLHASRKSTLLLFQRYFMSFSITLIFSHYLCFLQCTPMHNDCAKLNMPESSWACATNVSLEPSIMNSWIDHNAGSDCETLKHNSLTLLSVMNKRTHARGRRCAIFARQSRKYIGANRRPKSEGMHPEFEKALLTWVSEMHAEGANASSEMIKEIGFRILHKINEMLLDEKKIRLTFSNVWLFEIQRRWRHRSWKSYGAIVRCILDTWLLLGL